MALTDEQIEARADVNSKCPYISHERRKNSRGQTVVHVVRRCEKHGEFEQILRSIDRGQGCPGCSSSAPVSDENIRSRASVDPKYSYICCERRKDESGARVIYVTRKCEEHGEFAQSLSRIGNGQGCPSCSLYGPLADNDIRAQADVNPKYPYINYERRKDNRGSIVICVTRRCKEHGKFEQLLSSIRNGQGCPGCSSSAPVSDENIRSRASVDPKYSYVCYERRKAKNGSPVIYVTRQCEEHGEFEQKLLRIDIGQGCPGCAIGGFDPTKPAIIYYLRLDTLDGMLYKIGITNKTVMDRYPSLRDQALIEIVYQQRFKVGADAHAAEQQIIDDNIEHQYKGEWRFSCGAGGRELFTEELSLDGMFA